jgi:hypothetical protein
MEYDLIGALHIDLRNQRAEQIVIKITQCIETIKKRLSLFNAFFVTVVDGGNGKYVIFVNKFLS